MTINYTTLLGLAKPVTGTETGQWGDVVNDEITSLLEDAVANAASISVTSGDVTLTTTNGSSNQARMSTLIITGSPGTTRNVIAPSQAKIYQVINQSDGAVVIKGSATTGVTIAAGATGTVVWNGSDFVEVNSTSSGRIIKGNLQVTGNLQVDGNTQLGNSTSDTLAVTALVNSNFLFTDATYDIGASGANRPRDLFLSRNITVGGNTTLGDATSDSVTFNALVGSNLLFTDNTYDIGANGATRPRSIFAATGITSQGRAAVGSIDNGISLNVNRNLSGNTSAIQVSSYGTVASDVTSAGFGFYSYLTTAAASFTLPSYYHHAAIQGPIGAGSAVTSQFGYYVDGNLTGATNNYGFYGNIASGTGRYNLYMAGTAANYLGGSTNVNNNLIVSSGTLYVGSGGSDIGTQLNLWSDPSGNCFLAGYNFQFNVGNNNARTTKMLLDNAGRLTVGASSSLGYTLGVAGSVGVYDSGSNTSIALQNTGSGGSSFRWLAGKTGDTFPGGFGFYDDTAAIYRIAVNSSGQVIFGSSSASLLLNPSANIYPALGRMSLQAPTGSVAALSLSGSSGSVAANMGGIIDFYAPYRTADYDQYYTGRIFAYRENATNNVGSSYMGMQTSTAGFVSTYFLYADSSQRVSLNNKNLQASYGLTSGRIYVDATGAAVSPDTSGNGLISMVGNGYNSYWTMDNVGVYFGQNSDARSINLGTRSGTYNNPASISIQSSAENNTIYANYYGVSIKSGGRQSGGYGIYCDVGLALWGLVGALTTGGTEDWNHISNAHSGQGYTLLLGTASNGPGGGSYYHPWNFEYSSKDGNGNITQWAVPYVANGSNNNYQRSRYDGSWGSWYVF